MKPVLAEVTSLRLVFAVFLRPLSLRLRVVAGPVGTRSQWCGRDDVMGATACALACRAEDARALTWFADMVR